MSNVPTELRYTVDHEWLNPEGDSWKVGITQFAVNQLGDIVMVELPKVGTKLDMGDSFGTIESVKSVSELFAPVSGEIVAINEALADSPELINNDPYGEGWLVTIKPRDKAELDELKQPDAYDKLTAEQ